MMVPSAQAGNDLLGGGLLDKPTPSVLPTCLLATWCACSRNFNRSDGYGSRQAPSTGLGDGFDPFAAWGPQVTKGHLGLQGNPSSAESRAAGSAPAATPSFDPFANAGLVSCPDASQCRGSFSFDLHCDSSGQGSGGAGARLGKPPSARL